MGVRSFKVARLGSDLGIGLKIGEGSDRRQARVSRNWTRFCGRSVRAACSYINIMIFCFQFFDVTTAAHFYTVCSSRVSAVAYVP